jgi:putative phage-type endonuclease
VPIEILADLTEIQPSSPEWLELRKLGLGGSDAGAVCGLSRFRTPYQVWAEKVNPSMPEEREEPEYLRWGKLLEPIVREEFTTRTGIEVHPLPRTDTPFMLANVDGLTGSAAKLEGAYEGKTTRRSDLWPIVDDVVQVPLETVVQGMHYLAVLGLERIHFACLVGGQELRIAEVDRNENLIADLIEIEEAFWRKVIDRDPVDVGAADVSTLRKRWVPEAGKTIELTGTFATSLKVRAQHKANIKQLEEEVDKIDAELMAFMGDAEEATWKGKTAITWKLDNKGKLKGKELEAAHPEIAAEFRGEPGRRFLPKEIGEQNEETDQ